MKLFKRTVIFLLIFIIVVWVANFLWVYYPSNTVNATKSEIKQTEILLKESDISVNENILTQKTKSVKTPQIEFIAQDNDLFNENVSKNKLKKISENEYMYGDNTLTIDGNSLIFEGYSDIIEKNTPDTAIIKAKKLISYLSLSTKHMLVSMQEKQDGIMVIFIPEYKNRPVFDCKISVMMYGAKKYKVTASPYRLEENGLKELPSTVCTALAELALSGKAKYNEITETTLGYKFESGKLVPAWEIKTKEKNTFYIR